MARGFLGAQEQFRPFTLNLSPFLRARQSPNVHLGDVVHEIPPDKLAANLRIFTADLPPDTASTFKARIDACLKTRDEAIVAVGAQSEEWSGMTAGVAAEKQAVNCLSNIRSEINAALMPTRPTDPVKRTEPVKPTDIPVQTPASASTSNIVAPVAVGAAIIAAVFLLS